MVEGNLLAARAQGRNRFYRLASSDVAHAIESLMALAGTRAPPAAHRRRVAARSRPALLPHLLRPSGGPGRHRRDRCADPRRPYRAQGRARLEAHRGGRAVLPAASASTCRARAAPAAVTSRASASTGASGGRTSRARWARPSPTPSSAAAGPSGCGAAARCGLPIQDGGRSAATSAPRSRRALPKASPSPDGILAIDEARRIFSSPTVR